MAADQENPATSEDPRRFEFKEGTSAKFWEIKLDETSHTVTYGRIGTAGTEKTKDFPDVEKARKSYDKLIAAKTKKGYSELKQAEPMSPEEIKAAKAYAKKVKPFLQAILKDPDDVGNYSILGDWLTEQGDERGEFVGVQIALESDSLTAAQRKKLQKQEKDLLEKHQRTWLGELAPHLIDQKDFEAGWRGTVGYEFKFARGVLDTIRMLDYSLELGHLLKNSIHCSTLRRLIIEDTGYLEEPVTIAGTTYDEDSGVDTLVGGKFQNVRVFQLGGGDEGNCHTQGELAADIVKAMPRIEELQLEARGVDTKKLFALKMPNLRSLIVHHIHEYPLEILAKNKSLTNLETLQMHPHAFEYDADVSAYLRLEHIEAIGKSKNLGSLKHLQFRLSDMGDPGAEAIVKTGLLGRLKTLDLTHGCITNAGVDILVASPELANLEMLILDGNAITSEGVAKLKKSKVKHSVKEQLNPEGIDEEREYLWYGDME